MPPRKTRTFNQWQSMQKAKSNGKGEKKFFFPACQLERARVLGFLAKHLAAIKGNKGSKGIPWNKFGPMGHLGYLGPMSTKAGPLVFGAQAGLHLPLLESEPTSYGGGP